MELVKNKSKTAAWFFSVRETSSNRINLYLKLKEFIEIDVYGRNEKLKCDPYPARCVEDMNKTYMFYLGFENALCEDYLSEKSFRALEDSVVPVVFSGANLTRFLPPKSYIDANSFKTAEDLGAFLKNLANNKEEYLKYFWWKKHYKIEQWWIDFCEVCKKLNKIIEEPHANSYGNIFEFYFKDKCSKPNIKF